MASPEPARHEVFHKGIIILAEDDTHTRGALEYALENEGYLVFSAYDGLEAAAHMSTSMLPAVALLDLQMPRMSGYELISAMRRDLLLCRVPIIVVTGQNVERIEGVQRVLHKPCEAGEVLAAVSEALGLPFRHNWEARGNS